MLEGDPVTGQSESSILEHKGRRAAGFDALARAGADELRVVRALIRRAGGDERAGREQKRCEKCGLRVHDGTPIERMNERARREAYARRPTIRYGQRSSQ